MHACDECGANLATAGALALHETTAHSVLSMDAAPAARPAHKLRKPAAPRRIGGAVVAVIGIVALVGAALLLGVGGRAVYRSLAKKSPAPAAADQPAAVPAQPAQPAAHAPAKATPAPAAASSGQLAVARQKYLAVAAAYGAAMAHSHDGLPPMSGQIWSRYAAALRGYDAGLRAIAFPSSVRPAAAALLADDAQIEGDFDRLAIDGACSTCHDIQLKPKIAADVERLRAALGLPPGGDASTEPGH